MTGKSKPTAKPYVCVRGFDHEPDGKPPQRFEVGDPVELPLSVLKRLADRGLVKSDG